MFTNNGLPLDQSVFGASPTAHVGSDGPTRRVECRPTQLLAAPSLRPSTKAAPSLSSPQPQSRPVLVLGLNESSLIDDDDDEIIDYFSSPCAAPRREGAVTPTPDSPWDVRDHNVPTLPSFYPIEKSAVFVPQASTSALAARIVSALHSRSVASTFDAEHAKIDCVSGSDVEFRVRLYRGRGEEQSHGIIVEVQRRWGFDVSYAQDVYAVLDAAEER